MLDAGVRTVVPNGVGELGRLDRAVVEAIAYADVFGWPLTGDEIHRYLPVVASVDEVRASLASCRLDAVVSSIDGLYVLLGRERLVEERSRAAAVSARLWPRALRYGRWIARLPWVRLVAVSGSLAVGAPTDDADVDLFVVSAEGRLWLTRALTIGVVKLASRVRARVPGGAVPELRRHHRRARADRTGPVHRARTRATRAARGSRDLPRAPRREPVVPAVPAEPSRLRASIAELGGGRVRTVLETALRNALVGRRRTMGDAAEGRASRAQQPSDEVRFDESVCKGHFEGHRRRALEAATP